MINWNGYTADQKRVVDSRLSQFLSQCVSNKLRVVDAKLLEWQLGVQQISYSKGHDEYCWTYSLIKAGARQIQQPAEYGFELDIRYRELSLVELKDLIDQEFFTLSEAHYDRYMLTPDMFVGQNE